MVVKIQIPSYWCWYNSRVSSATTSILLPYSHDVVKNVEVAAFADDIAYLRQQSCWSIGKLKFRLDAFQDLLYKWMINKNSTKYVHVTFSTRRSTYPPIGFYRNLPHATPKSVISECGWIIYLQIIWIHCIHWFSWNVMFKNVKTYPGLGCDTNHP